MAGKSCGENTLFLNNIKKYKKLVLETTAITWLLKVMRGDQIAIPFNHPIYGSD